LIFHSVGYVFIYSSWGLRGVLLFVPGALLVMRHSLKTTAAIFHNDEGVMLALRGKNGRGIRGRNTNITTIM